MTLTLRARLTLWYTLALLAVMCLFAVDVLWVQGRLGERRVDRELGGYATTIANILESEFAELATPADAAREATREVAAPGRAVAVLDADGRVLGANWGGLTLPPPWPAASGGARTWSAQTASGAWRIRAEPRTIGPATVVIVTASPLQDIHRERREVQEAMLVGVPIALVLAALGGLWLASVGLRPVAEMARQATEIPIGGTEALGNPERTDELGQLARAFNGLLTRLRSALQTQRQFMADASHELRTPVSIIRTAADVALSRDHRDEPYYRDTLAVVGAQSERLSRLVANMLVLARADAGGYLLQPVNLYLDDLLTECLRAVSVLAAERGVKLEGRGWPALPIRGDEDLLRQMIVNVLQNAVQHTPRGGAIEVTAAAAHGGVDIRVGDNGPGIPDADRDRIFERFVQLDPARRADGTGLGLPIARWIAEAHQGALVLESSGPGGSTFRISLPAAAIAAV